MGTSKSNISDKVKKLLKDKPFQELNNMAPEVSKKVLTKKELNNYLGDEKNIIQSFEIVSKNFKGISSGGFKGKSKKEIIENHLTLEEFLTMILDQLDDLGIITNSLLEKAYKIAMTKCLQDEEFDIYIFAQLLFYHLIQEILKKDLYDTLKNIYDEVPYDKINKLILNLTDQIMNTSIYSLVDEFVNKKIPITNVINAIVSETQNASFGEF